MRNVLNNASRIDHIAIAVKDLEEAVALYEGVFGFKLLKQREVKGAFTGMKSAELDAGGFSIVLVQGTDPESQVTRYIQEYGPGVQHVAIEVDDVAAVTESLGEAGVSFATNVIRGDGLIQRFTKRDSNTGMMFEYIQRVTNTKGFDVGNIQQLFEQLEANEVY